MCISCAVTTHEYEYEYYTIALVGHSVQHEVLRAYVNVQYAVSLRYVAHGTFSLC